ncbi:ERMES complex subunit mmm1 [Irineochytrium annulatum]|nr:ERMES complex subunit mmm1 [Irineochytrium annulatum]
MDEALEAAVNLANKEFIKVRNPSRRYRQMKISSYVHKEQGFIAGQMIICVLLFLLVKVFLLRNGEETRIEAKRIRTLWEPKHRAPLRQHAFESHVLSKMQYEVHSHPAETCDWINVVMGQIIARYRSDPAFTSNVITFLDYSLNGPARPGFLGPITITDFSLGEEYPILKTASMRFAEQSSNLVVSPRAEIAFEVNDQITLGIDTQVLINWPKELTASLPVSLNISVVKFSGTIAMEFVAHPESSETYLAVSILQDFVLDFEVRSLLGHRTKVKDLPKLTSLITSKLRSILTESVVWPNFQRVHLTSSTPLNASY